MNETNKIGCAILTRQAKRQLPHCLQFLLQSPLKPRILVIDSSSTDGTVEFAKNMGVETIVIPQSQFNHGTTREFARKQLGTDIVCMFTQDAYLVDKEALTHLVKPIVEQKASITYARQIPHAGADFFASFAREFNYPPESHTRDINDIDLHGIYTFFCSDSCSAYSNDALDEIGGFQAVLLGEDTIATAKLLRKGHKIAYVAEAKVRHSHSYSLKNEFQRHFDTGLVRTLYKDLLNCTEGDTQRGCAYAKALITKLAKDAPHKIPYAIAHLASKWSGYKVGSLCQHAPNWIKRTLSSQKYYWSKLEVQ